MVALEKVALKGITTEVIDLVKEIPDLEMGVGVVVKTDKTDVKKVELTDRVNRTNHRLRKKMIDQISKRENVLVIEIQGIINERRK